MKKIIYFIVKPIAKVFAAIDNFLYRYFGVVSPARKAKWHRNAVEIQNRLDEEHILTSVYNYEHCSYLTTKAVMDRIKW